MIQTIPYKPEHARQINLRAVELAHGDKDFYSSLTRTGPAFTLTVDSEPIGCAGIEIYWPGFGEAWGLFGIYVYQYPIAIFKAVKKGLADIMNQKNLSRVQAVAMKDFKAAAKFLERLGFEYEGEMRKYGPGGETFLRYARII